MCVYFIFNNDYRHTFIIHYTYILNYKSNCKVSKAFNGNLFIVTKFFTLIIFIITNIT